MKLMLALTLCAALLAALATARPQTRDGEAVIEEFSAVNEGTGEYSFGYKTSNGIIRQEQGVLKNAGTDQEEWETTGTITWIGADGVENKLVFIANKDGFQPVVSPSRRR